MKDSGKIISGEILGRVESMEIKGVSIDSRTIKEGELFVAIRGDRFDGHDFVPEAIKRGAWGAMVERSVLENKYASLGGLKNIIAVEDTLLSLQEMAAAHRKKFSIPMIGITGSNGKTTTKEMLACILRQKGPVLKNEGNLNNHIGVPLTLMKLDKSHKTAVVEMGMSGPGEIKMLTRLVMPTVGVITNIGPAHLEFLGSMDMVVQAKGELLENMEPNGIAVLNTDDSYFEMLKNKFGGSVVTFGIVAGAEVAAADIRQEKSVTDFSIRSGGASVRVRLQAVGRHNVYNALAAAAAALAVGMPLESVKYGLEDFSPIAMRSELRQIKGRLVLDDCYNANPRSMEAALETLVSIRQGGMIIAVLGDMLELGETSADAHRAVGATAARLGVDLLITVGTLSKLIGDGAREAGMPKERVVAAKSNAEAAVVLKERSKNGDAILIKGSRAMKMEEILEEF